METLTIFCILFGIGLIFREIRNSKKEIIDSEIQRILREKGLE